MSTFSALPQSNPNEIKKTHTGRFVVVGLVAILAIIITIIASGALSSGTVNNSNYVPTSYTVSLISGSIAVNANSYNFVSFFCSKRRFKSRSPRKFHFLR